MNKKYRGLEAYTPGEQPTDQKYIKLNTNESPYPPSDKVLSAVDSAAVSRLNLYPDPTCKGLKTKLAALFGVERENIFVSNGSDDILNFSFMAFCDGDERAVLFPEISYGFYRVYAELYGVSYEARPLLDDFSIDINDYMVKGKTVVIANPNAPTGLALSVEDIEKIIAYDTDRLVLIDEAYVDFGAQSCIPLTKKYDNLLVVGTFSKSRSLAGARLGFAVGNAEIIADLEKIKYSTNPYNINRLTLAAGEAAVDDNSYYMDHCLDIIRTRESTQKALKKLGFFVTDSKANFIFAKSPDIAGDELYRELKRRGILVRHFEGPLICDYNRITVGTDEEMRALVETIEDILKKRK